MKRRLMPDIMPVKSNTKKGLGILIVVFLYWGIRLNASPTADLLTFEVCPQIEASDGDFFTDPLYFNLIPDGNADIMGFHGDLIFELWSPNHEVPAMSADLLTTCLGTIGTDVTATTINAPGNSLFIEYRRDDNTNIPVGTAPMARAAGCITTIDQLRTWTSPPVTINSVFQLNIRLENFEVMQWDSTIQAPSTTAMDDCILTIWIEEIPDCELSINIEGQTELCVGDTVTYTSSVTFDNMMNPLYQSAVDSQFYYNDCDIITAAIAPCGNDGANEYLLFRNNTGIVGLNNIVIAVGDDSGVIQQVWGATLPSPALSHNWLTPDPTTAALTTELNSLAACVSEDMFIEPDGDLIPDTTVIIAFLGAGDGNGFDDAANNLNFSDLCQFAPIHIIYGDAAESDYWSNTNAGTILLDINGLSSNTVSYTPISSDPNAQQFAIGCTGNVIELANCNELPLNNCYEWTLDGVPYPGEETLTFIAETEGSQNIGLIAGNCIACIDSTNLLIDVAICEIDSCETLTGSILAISNETCIENDGTVTIDLSDATPPYQVWIVDNDWTNPAPPLVDTFSISPLTMAGLTTGDYTVAIFDANGCQPTCPGFTIEMDAIIQLSITSTSVSCSEADTININGLIPCDGSAFVEALYGTAPFSYEWSNGYSGFPDIKNLCPGEYSVTVTDANGCMGTASVEITQPESITLDYDEVIDASCGLNNGTVVLNPGGGTPPYEFQIMGPFTNPINYYNTSGFFENLEPGQYIARVVDANGCLYQCPIGFEIEPGGSNISATLLGQDLDCPVSTDTTNTYIPNGEILASVTGGTPPYSYNWSNGATTAMIDFLPPGMYEVSIEDATGCTWIDDIVIGAPPSLTLDITTVPTCPGMSAGSIEILASGGNGSPYTYSINGISYGNSGFADQLPVDTYTIQVEDINGCYETAIVAITDEGFLTINSTVYDISCAGLTNGAIDLNITTGTAPYEFIWDNGETTGYISDLSVGNYTVTATDASGCISIASYAINEPDELEVTSSATNLTCAANTNTYDSDAYDSDGSINITVLGGTPPYTYDWSTGATSNNLDNLSPGMYEVSVYDDNACFQTALIEILAPLAFILNVETDSVSCSGYNDGSITVNGGGGSGTFLSYTLDGTDMGIINTFTDLAAGSYTVGICDANLCCRDTTVTIGVANSILLEMTSVNISCYGDSNGLIAGLASGGTPPYVSTLDGIEINGSIIDGLEAGTYMYGVEDANGCYTEQAVTISEPLPIGIEVINIQPACQGQNNGNISVVASGGTNDTLLYGINGSDWVYSDLGAVFPDLFAGDYILTIKNEDGSCPEYLDVTVPEGYDSLRLEVLSVTSISCFGAADGEATVIANGGIGPYAYRLHDQTEWSLTGEFTDIDAGTYQIWIQDLGGGCDSICVPGFEIENSLIICGPSGFQNMVIAPTPAQKSTTVSFGRNMVIGTGYRLRALSVSSGTMNELALAPNQENLQLTVDEWVSGLYILTLYNDKGKIMATQRLVVADGK